MTATPLSPEPSDAAAQFSPGVRWGVLRLLGLLVVAGLLVWGPMWLWRAWGPYDTEAGLLASLRAITIYYSALSLAAITYCLRSAWRIARSGRSPFPGQWLFVRRRIRRGAWAYAEAASFVALAGVAVVLLVMAWRELQAAAVLFGIGSYAP